MACATNGLWLLRPRSPGARSLRSLPAEVTTWSHCDERGLPRAIRKPLVTRLELDAVGIKGH